MKEALENKISEVIYSIIDKQPDNITYNEYRILDAKLREIKYEEEQRERNKRLMSTIGECVCGGFGSAYSPLPESGE